MRFHVQVELPEVMYQKVARSTLTEQKKQKLELGSSMRTPMTHLQNPIHTPEKPPKSTAMETHHF